ADTDDDFMPDGWEAYYGLNPLHDGTYVYSYNNDKTYTQTSDPNPDEGADGDFDNDNLTNSEEYNYTYNLFEEEIKTYKIGCVFGKGLDPKNNDTDNDLLEDGKEIKEYFLYANLSEDDAYYYGLYEYYLGLTSYFQVGWHIPIIYTGYYKMSLATFAAVDQDDAEMPEITMQIKSEEMNLTLSPDTSIKTYIWHGISGYAIWWYNYTFNAEIPNALYNMSVTIVNPIIGVYLLRIEKHGIDPLNPDTDYDEIEDGNETVYDTNPLKPDTDDDGLRDIVELNMGLDPCNPDTDNDGVWDGHDLQPNMNWSNFQWQNEFQPGMINYTQEFHVYHSSSSKPSDSTVRSKIYSLCGTDFTVTGIDYLGLNNSYHNEDGTDWGSWTFYEHIFNLTFENAVNISTNGYDYTLLELPFKANREQTVTVQLSTDDTGYTYDDKWRRIGFYYVLYEDKNFGKVYENISVSSNLNKGGVQVDMTIPREYAPSVDKTMVLQITPVWVYGNKTGVGGMNFLGYRYWDMWTESHIYYNDAVEFKIASVTLSVHHLSYIVLARPTMNLTGLNQKVSG
ncbi:MAG: hypothetical protein L6265_05160, partial [Thermoplasmatales archaeon]|nr:hypothetical protein [Thermoplasmatales archaeon]